MSLKIKEFYTPNIYQKKGAETSYVTKFKSYVRRNRKIQNTFEERVSKYSRNSSISRKSGRNSSDKGSLNKKSLKKMSYKNSVLFKKTKKILNGTLNLSHKTPDSGSKKRNISCGNLGRSRYRSKGNLSPKMEYPKFAEKIHLGLKSKKRANSSTCKIRTRLQNVLGVDKKKFQAKVFSPLISNSGHSKAYFSGLAPPQSRDKSQNSKNGKSQIQSLLLKHNRTINSKLLNKQTKTVNLVDFYKKRSRSSTTPSNGKSPLEEDKITTPSLFKASKVINNEISTANTQNFSSRSSRKNTTPRRKMKSREGSYGARRIAQFTTSSKKRRRDSSKGYFSEKENEKNVPEKRLNFDKNTLLGKNHHHAQNKLSQIFKKNIVIKSRANNGEKGLKMGSRKYYRTVYEEYSLFKDLSFFEKTGFQLYSINKKLHSNQDVYDLIRLYAEFAQEKDFNSIEKIFENDEVKKKFSNILKIERWVIVILFFNKIRDPDKTTPVLNSYVNKAVEWAWENHNNLVNWIKLLNKEHRMNWILNDINRIYWDVGMGMDMLIKDIDEKYNSILRILDKL